MSFDATVSLLERAGCELSAITPCKVGDAAQAQVSTEQCANPEITVPAYALRKQIAAEREHKRANLAAR